MTVNQRIELLLRSIESRDRQLAELKQTVAEQVAESARNAAAIQKLQWIAEPDAGVF